MRGYAVLISSTVAYVPMKEKKMKMSHNNLILGEVHLHICTVEMKYEVWRVSPIYK